MLVELKLSWSCLKFKFYVYVNLVSKTNIKDLLSFGEFQVHALSGVIKYCHVFIICNHFRVLL